MNNDFRQSNTAADAAFARVFPKAASVDWSIGVLTGDIPLSPEQTEFLGHCGGFQSRLNNEPLYGHLAVRCLGTKGCGNQAASVMLFPATDECRRWVNAVRRSRWATWFAASTGVTAFTAESLWYDAQGHVPTLDAIVELWQFRKLSDRALRDIGFRPRHPVEGDAIKIVRGYA